MHDMMNHQIQIQILKYMSRGFQIVHIFIIAKTSRYLGRSVS